MMTPRSEYSTAAWPTEINELGATTTEQSLLGSSVTEHRATVPNNYGDPGDVIDDPEVAEESVPIEVDPVTDSIDTPQEPPIDPPETGRAASPDPEEPEPTWSQQMGASLRDRANERGQQATSIARELGISVVVIRKLFDGKVTLQPETVRTVAKHLGETDEAADTLAQLQQNFRLNEVVEAADIAGVDASRLFTSDEDTEAYEVYADQDKTPGDIAEHYGRDRSTDNKFVRDVDNKMAHKVLIMAPHLLPIINELRELKWLDSEANMSTRTAMAKLGEYMAQQGEELRNYMPGTDEDLERILWNTDLSNRQVGDMLKLPRDQVEVIRRALFDEALYAYKHDFHNRTERAESRAAADQNLPEGGWRNTAQQANIQRLKSGETIEAVARRLGIDAESIVAYLTSTGPVSEQTIRTILSDFDHEPEIIEAAIRQYDNTPKTPSSFVSPWKSPAERAEQIGITANEIARATQELGVQNDASLDDTQSQALTYVQAHPRSDYEQLGEHLGVPADEAARIIRSAIGTIVDEHPLLLGLVRGLRTHPDAPIDSSPHRNTIYQLTKTATTHAIDTAEVRLAEPVVDPEVDAMLANPTLSDRAIAARLGMNIRQVGNYRRILAERLEAHVESAMQVKSIAATSKAPDTRSIRQQLADTLYDRAKQEYGSMYEATRAADVSLTEVSAMFAPSENTYSPHAVIKLAKQLGFEISETFNIVRMHRNDNASDMHRRTGFVRLLGDMDMMAMVEGVNWKTIVLSDYHKRMYATLSNPALSMQDISARLRMTPEQVENSAYGLLRTLQGIPQLSQLFGRIPR